METKSISLGAVEDSNDQLNKFGTLISRRMVEIFQTEIIKYPDNGDYLFIAPMLIGKITKRDALMAKEGKVSSEIIFGTGMIVFDNDLLSYSTNPEIADNIHKMLYKLLNHADKQYVGEVDIERQLIEQVAKEQHLRLKASNEREEIRKQFEKVIAAAKEIEGALSKKITHLEEQLSEKTKEAEHFKELYGKAKKR
jgi:hypothetical protein